MPIGPCEPRDAMKHAHMDSNDAIQACKILKANNFFPIHWGTFRFGDELPRLPIDRLTRQWNEEKHRAEAILHVPKAGQKMIIDQCDSNVVLSPLKITSAPSPVHPESEPCERLEP